MSKIDIDKFVEHLVKLGVLNYNAVQSALFAQGLILSNYKIEKIGENSTDPQFGKSIEQNPAEWSEEDEKVWKELIEEVKDQLDSVPSPDCRDKEDEKALKQLTRWLVWLKSLKERCTWKPSDEQITVLELASKYERVFTPKQIDILIGLKEQLKKVKGE